MKLFSTVRACDLPARSMLSNRIQASDFVDCYCVKASIAPRPAAHIITNFPGWADFLLEIRRWVTSPFGLSQDGPDAANKIGVFPVESESDEELIAGFNDKHLDFRISVISEQEQVFLGTWVHPHNIGGRLYLRCILPFHILIAREALLRVKCVSDFAEQ